ncbi:MAG: TonB-dependent siderophore receptor, partial [Azoarcus sp.]|nr:TonB-dependent siderophore receptor [Azoarcus sp.]
MTFLGIFCMGVAQAQNADSETSSPDEETVLPAISVTASPEPSAVTEGSGSYTTPQMSTATKLPLAIRETPQSVTVITRQRIEDQNMVTIDDVVQNTPGLTAAGLPGLNSFSARGFAVHRFTFDGLPAANGNRGEVLLTDMAIYDHIEFVRGATGLTQGAGNPSASINLVRKHPTHDLQFRLNGNAGSWDRYGAEMDISGPLNAAKTLRARAVAAWQDHDSFADVASSQHKTLYFIAEADLSRDTLLTVSASRQENDSVPAQGIPRLPVAADGSDLKLPRSTFLGNEWEYRNRENTSAFASLEHRFDNRWKLNFSLNYTQAEQRMRYSWNSWNATTSQYDHGAGKYIYQDEWTSYEFHANGPFRLLEREHELAVGLSRRDGKFHGYGGGAALSTGMDIHHWNPSLLPKPSINLNAWLLHTDTEQTGVYVTTRLNLADPLKLILGARLDWYTYESKSLTAKTADYKVNHNLTKYAGLIYDLDTRHSVYASYTDIFLPQNNYNVSSNLLDPVVGKNYEIGVKGEYFDGALNASAALFRIDQEKLAMQLDDQSICPSYPATYCYRAAGLVRSQGVDLEIQGAITSNWQIGAGYTFVDKETRKDANPANVGQRASTELPQHQVKLFTSYRHGPWRVGGGVNWQSDIYYKRAGFHSRQDAYAVANLMAAYQFGKHLNIQLNVNNLFD